MRHLLSRIGTVTALTMVAAALTAVPATSASAAPGDADRAFNAAMRSNFTQYPTFVNAIAVQPDGKIVTGGNYRDNPISNFLSRFHADGTPDLAFNATVGALGLEGTVWSVFIQPDGKILAGLQFPNLGSYVLRLNPDGSLDRDFANNVTGFIDGGVWDVRAQADGKILIGGAFRTPGQYLARLNSDGTPDLAFNATVGDAFNDWVQETEILPDGSIIAVGPFTQPSSYVVKLLPNGERDIDFIINSGGLLDDDAQSVAVQSDGKLLIAGEFDLPAPKLVRLHADGRPDQSFNDAVVESLSGQGAALHVLATEGRILLGGSFGIRGQADLTRVSAFTYRGRLDSAFTERVADIAPDVTVQWLALQRNGKVLVGGTEDPRRALVRIDNGPLAPTAFFIRSKSRGRILLKWSASGSESVAGYVVKIKKGRGGAKIQDVGDVLKKVYDVRVGKRACYRVAAVDTSGTRSVWSHKKCGTARA